MRSTALPTTCHGHTRLQRRGARRRGLFHEPRGAPPKRCRRRRYRLCHRSPYGARRFVECVRHRGRQHPATPLSQVPGLLAPVPPAWRTGPGRAPGSRGPGPPRPMAPRRYALSASHTPSRRTRHRLPALSARRLPGLGPGFPWQSSIRVLRTTVRQPLVFLTRFLSRPAVSCWPPAERCLAAVQSQVDGFASIGVHSRLCLA